MKILTYLTNRAFPNLKIGIKRIRKASFLELFESDLKDIINKQLGKIYYQDKHFTLFFYAKNAFNTDYELFFNCFPANTIATHSIDELDNHYRNIFFNGIQNSQFAIKELAEKNNKKLLRIYSYQHIGANELNLHDFKTTYPQTHWHIYGVDKSTIDKCITLKHEEHCFLNTFHEFFIELYADLLGQGAASIDYNTHSIILKEKKLSLTMDSDDKSLISNVLVKWKSVWKEIASCFTNFGISNQERFVINSENQIMDNLNRLIDKSAISFSNEAKKRLFWLAKKIKKEANLNDSKSKEYWRTIHMGINGSIGITHDFINETSTLRIAPRTFATMERIGCLDRFYFCLKNRQVYLPDYQISEISRVQSELFTIIKSKT